MTAMTRARIAVLASAGVAVLLATAGPATAQCAMCRMALEQQGPQLVLSFNHAILFLLGMPYLIFATVAGSWYWKRRRRSALPGP